VGGSTVTATVLDNGGDGIEGVSVDFATDLGTLSSASATTDADGAATVTLTSTVVGTAAVTAEAIGVTSPTETVTVEPADVDEVTVSPSPSQIPPDGVTPSTILVSAEDPFGNPVEGTVSLVTNLGTLSADSVDLVDGQGSVTLVSAIGGQGTITATLDGVFDFGGFVVTEDLSGEPSSIQILADPLTLSVRGVGGNEVASLDITVLDLAGDPIDDSGVLDNLMLEIIDGPGGGENIAGNFMGGALILTTVNGRATASFQSGLLPGTVRIQASVTKNKDGTDRDPELTAVVPQITIQAGPPFSVLLTASNSIQDNGDGTLTHEYLATVSDRYGNNVPDDTSVYFGQFINILFEGVDGGTAAGSSTFTVSDAGFAGFDALGVTAGDTLVIFDDDSNQRGGYLVTGNPTGSSVTLLKEFDETETGLRFAVGNNKGGGVLTATQTVNTIEGEARWPNTYPCELVNSPVYIYAETSGRTLGDARPFDLAWVAPTSITLSTLPDEILVGNVEVLGAAFFVTDGSSPTPYSIPDLDFAVGATSGTISDVLPANGQTTPRAPEDKDPGGAGSFTWTVGPLVDGEEAIVFVSAGGATVEHTITAISP
jgi:hypothetical protein